MKKSVILILALTGLFWSAKAQLYSTKAGNASFFSTTPVEDIDAHSHQGLAVLNTTTNELAVMIRNTSFEFKNKLMEEHFNEKYMESEKYPTSTFRGKINEVIDYKKDGEYPVTVTGDLNIHGISIKRTISGTIKISGENPQLIAEFKVKVKDHKIEIPTLVTAKIAEELTIKVNLALMPKQ